MNVDTPASSSKDTSTETPLWEFVRPADYALPTTAVASTALQKWNKFKKIFQRKNDEDSLTSFKVEDELEKLSQECLASLIAPIDWNLLADALDRALGDWLNSPSPDSPVKLIIGQPHAGNRELLDIWASRHEARRVEAPSPDQILDCDPNWFSNLPVGERLWVLPHLEHCYLRHVNGLDFIRLFLERAFSGELGTGVIGCDSWAWAYLQRACLIPQWDALTLQGFDGQRLSRLFSGLVRGERQGRLQFRNARNGKTILSAPLEKEDEISADLNQLAGRCRGNFGRAVLYWRLRMRAEAEKKEVEGEEQQEEKDGKEPEPSNGEGESVWIADLTEDPVLPAEKEEEMDFVLHALLLHNGLPESLLLDLLPLPRYRIVSLVRRLQSLGIVDREGDRYKVTAVGYCAAREHLAARDYLLDDF